MTADTAAPGSPQPRIDGTISRCAVELIGMNSVKPCTRPRTMASMMVIGLLFSGQWSAASGQIKKTLATDHSHLPDHRQNHRTATHFLAEVALEQTAHFLLRDVVVEQFIGRTRVQHLHELCANLGEDVLAFVDVQKPACDDLRLASDTPVRIDGDDDDHESILSEVLAIAYDDLRHFLR